jgi:hypothetical protein
MVILLLFATRHARCDHRIASPCGESRGLCVCGEIGRYPGGDTVRPCNTCHGVRLPRSGGRPRLSEALHATVRSARCMRFECDPRRVCSDDHWAQGRGRRTGFSSQVKHKARPSQCVCQSVQRIKLINTSLHRNETRRVLPVISRRQDGVQVGLWYRQLISSCRVRPPLKRRTSRYLGCVIVAQQSTPSCTPTANP